MSGETDEELTTTQRQSIHQYQKRILELQQAESSLLTRISYLHSVWIASLQQMPNDVKNANSSSLFSKVQPKLQKGSKEEVPVISFPTRSNSEEGQLTNRIEKAQPDGAEEANGEETYLEMTLPNHFFTSTCASDPEFHCVRLPVEGLTKSNQERYISISQHTPHVVRRTTSSTENRKSNLPTPPQSDNSSLPEACRGLPLTVEVQKGVAGEEKALRGLDASRGSFVDSCFVSADSLQGFNPDFTPARCSSVTGFPGSLSSFSSTVSCASPFRPLDAGEASVPCASSLRPIGVAEPSQDESRGLSYFKGKPASPCSIDIKETREPTRTSSSPVLPASPSFSQDEENVFYEMNKARHKQRQCKRRRVDNNLRARLVALQYVHSPHDTPQPLENINTQEEALPPVKREEAVGSFISTLQTSSSCMCSPRRVSVGEFLSVLEPVKENTRKRNRPLNGLPKELGKKERKRKGARDTVEGCRQQMIEKNEFIPLSIEIGFPASQRRFLNSLPRPSGLPHNHEYERSWNQEEGNDFYEPHCSTADGTAPHSENKTSSIGLLSSISWGAERFKGMLCYTRTRERRLANFYKERKLRERYAPALLQRHLLEQSPQKQTKEAEEEQGYTEITAEKGRTVKRRIELGEDPPYCEFSTISLNETPPEFWSIDFPSFYLSTEAEKK